ncbi:MAG: hypothetical protein GC164_00785 [Phycisphaera sp.]|nr:hypothetical protein [Phycisphaera sp.]
MTRFAPPIFALMMILTAVGCTYRKVLNDPWAGLEQIADPPSPNTSGNPSKDPYAGRTSNEAQWTILLQTYEGKSRLAEATKLVDRMQRELGLRDLWVRDLDNTLYVQRGRFDKPSSFEARNTLRQTRMLQLDGKLAFPQADLIPLSRAAAQSVGKYDLRQYSGMYSLQIAFYDDTFGPDFRKAAEEAVAKLREGGDEAFYYHGPTRSLVTVGLFTDDDLLIVNHAQTYSEQVIELQKKYPYNLGNGLTLIEKRDGQTVGEQPSFLVRVP